MSTQALAGTSTKDKRRRHLSEAAFQDSIYITAKEGGAHSRDFRCPQCGACDALFRHEHLLPDNFWSYNDTAYQGAIFAASVFFLCRQGILPACPISQMAPIPHFRLHIVVALRSSHRVQCMRARMAGVAARSKAKDNPTLIKMS